MPLSTVSTGKRHIFTRPTDIVVFLVSSFPYLSRTRTHRGTPLVFISTTHRELCKHLTCTYRRCGCVTMWGQKTFPHCPPPFYRRHRLHMVLLLVRSCVGFGDKQRDPSLVGVSETCSQPRNFPADAVYSATHLTA